MRSDFEMLASQINSWEVSHAYEDHTNLRERIISRIPEAYGKLKSGTPLYDLIESIAKEMTEQKNQLRTIAQAVKQFCYEADRIQTEKDSMIADPSPFNDEGFSAEVDEKIAKHLERVQGLVMKQLKDMDEEGRTEFMRELQAL